MSLKQYVKKRVLKKSKEPKPKIFKRVKGEKVFVIQKHAARRLHYDLRLEVGGVLKSWAVPKEPVMDPAVKRLAIMVEDHPFAYKDFEGRIEEGYGKGTVEIWDKGTYFSEHSMREGIKNGAIAFTLNGKKLKGAFALVKLKNSTKNEWLLIKKR